MMKTMTIYSVLTTHRQCAYESESIYLCCCSAHNLHDSKKIVVSTEERNVNNAFASASASDVVVNRISCGVIFQYHHLYSSTSEL